VKTSKFYTGSPAIEAAPACGEPFSRISIPESMITEECTPNSSFWFSEDFHSARSLNLIRTLAYFVVVMSN